MYQCLYARLTHTQNQRERAILKAYLYHSQGPIAVQGSLSVLLDSSLCAMASVMCLTNQLPEVGTGLNKTHSRNLDNIAYIMPGIG